MMDTNCKMYLVYDDTFRFTSPDPWPLDSGEGVINLRSEYSVTFYFLSYKVVKVHSLQLYFRIIDNIEFVGLFFLEFRMMDGFAVYLNVIFSMFNVLYRIYSSYHSLHVPICCSRDVYLFHISNSDDLTACFSMFYE